MPSSEKAAVLRKGVFGLSFGSLTLLLVVIQVMTGLFLGLNYAAGIPDGYESTLRIVTGVSMGWVVRGMHRYCAYAIVIVGLLHLMSAFTRRSFRSRPGANWIIPNLVLSIIFVSIFTGTLMPLDEVSGCATRVALSLLASVPLVGKTVAGLLFGYTEGGNFNPHRFHLMHVSMLPMFALFFFWMHVRSKDRLFPGTGRVKSFLAVLVISLALMIVAAMFPPGLGKAFDFVKPVQTRVHPSWVFMSVYLLVGYLSSPDLLLAGVLASFIAWMALPWIDRRISSRTGQRTLTGLVFLLILLWAVSTVLAYPLSRTQ